MFPIQVPVLSQSLSQTYCLSLKGKIIQTHLNHKSITLRYRKSTAATLDQDATRDTESNYNSFAANMVNALFKYPPFFDAAKQQARSMMKKRGESIGASWDVETDRLKNFDWEAEYNSVLNPSLVLPEYYQVSFHAYEKGNLSWQAAWEAEVAAKTVHSPIFDPEAKKMDPDGDHQLRASYSGAMVPQLRREVRDVVDLGCATGLSSIALQAAFPQAQITGVDMSAYFLAVGQHRQRERRQAGVGTESPPIKMVHAAAEETTLPSDSFDLVSICLVCHELPQSATLKIMDEALRLLRPGGAFSIMEMNPKSAFLKKMSKNIFAFTALKSTEPYLDEYMSLNILEELKAKGFEVGKEMENSPRHRTIVAYKK